jgi:hypothetical protein
MKHALGFAVVTMHAVYAPVFYDRGTGIAGLGIAPASQILGLAIAHEIGHLLLCSREHARDGLMRAQWSGADLHLATVELLRFHPGEAKIMQMEILRRSRGQAASQPTN